MATTPTLIRNVPSADRPLRIGTRSLLTTGHRHVGSAKSPLVRQPPSEQVLYRSDDLGANWREWAMLACNPNLVLCEASMFKMPDGSLRAYLRENSATTASRPPATSGIPAGPSWPTATCSPSATTGAKHAFPT